MTGNPEVMPPDWSRETPLWEAKGKQSANGVKERFARAADRRQWMRNRHSGNGTCPKSSGRL